MKKWSKAFLPASGKLEDVSKAERVPTAISSTDTKIELACREMIWW